MGREKRARLRRRTPEELVVAHITTKRPIREEAKRYNKQRIQHLLLRKKNRHDHVKHAWHSKYDAMQLIQIKRNRIPTHTYMVQVVLLHDNLNID
jgi:hypothetical protein